MFAVHCPKLVQETIRWQLVLPKMERSILSVSHLIIPKMKQVIWMAFSSRSRGSVTAGAHQRSTVLQHDWRDMQPQNEWNIQFSHNAAVWLLIEYCRTDDVDALCEYQSGLNHPSELKNIPDLSSRLKHNANWWLCGERNSPVTPWPPSWQRMNVRQKTRKATTFSIWLRWVNSITSKFSPVWTLSSGRFSLLLISLQNF